MSRMLLLGKKCIPATRSLRVRLVSVKLGQGSDLAVVYDPKGEIATA